jgi:hypothetical protein
MTELSKRVQMLLAILFAATLIVAGCGGGDEGSTAEDPNAASATTTDAGAAANGAAATSGGATLQPVNENALVGSADYYGVVAGGAEATGMVGNFDMDTVNQNIKQWNIEGFSYAKQGGQYAAADNPAINEAGGWDAWGQAMAGDANNIQAFIDSIPDGYLLEIRGHADKTGPEQPVGNKPGNIAFSYERGCGVMAALNDRAQVNFRGKVFCSGVGSSQNVPDPDMLPNGRSSKNRRVTWHVVPRTEQ